MSVLLIILSIFLCEEVCDEESPEQQSAQWLEGAPQEFAARASERKREGNDRRPEKEPGNHFHRYCFAAFATIPASAVLPN